MKIGKKLTLAFSALVLVSATAGFISVYIAHAALKKTVGEGSLNLAERTMSEIDKDVFVRIAEMQAYASDLLLAAGVDAANRAFDRMPDVHGFIARADADWKAKKETPFIRGVLGNELSSELKRYYGFYEKKYGYPVFAEIYVTNKYGAVIGSTGRTSDYLQADEEWYQNALAAKGVWLGAVEYDESSDAVSVDIVLKLHDKKGKFAGILKGVLNISDIIEIINSVRAQSEYESTTVHLVDKKGFVIFSGLDPAAKAKGRDIRIGEFGEDISGREAVSKALKGENGYITVKEAGKEILSSFSRSKGYRDFEGLGWSAVIDFDADEVFGRVAAIRNSLLAVFAASSALIVFFGIMVSHSVSGGVEKLGYAAARIGRGDFSARASIASKDEIGELAAAFNAMAGELQKITVSRDYMESILENMMDCLVVTTADGTIQAVNNRVLELLGYAKEELLGRPVSVIFAVTGEEPAYGEDWLSRLSKGGPIRNTENTFASKDGKMTPVLVSASLMQGREAAAQGIIYAALDITERKRAEDEIKALARFPDENPNPVMRISKDGILLYANAAGVPLCKKWGCETGEPVPEDLARTVKEIYGPLKNKTIEVNSDKGIFAMVLSPVAGAGYVNAYGMEITERKLAELEIKKLSTAIEQSSNMVFITGANGVIEYVNAMFEQITGYSTEESIGQTPRILSSGETPDAVYEELWKTITAGLTWRGVFKNKKKNGAHYWCNSVITPVKDEGGKVINFLAVQEDITEKKASVERISYLAFHDDMTGLLNRARFMDMLSDWLSGRRGHGAGALLLMDLDQFKFINDTYGHGLGDEMLRAVSKTLQEAVKDVDSILSRLGGDEFAVFLPSTGEADGIAIAEKIRQRLEERHSGNLPVRTTASIGVALYPAHGATTGELFTKADAAMYRAKELGRNRVHLYRQADHVLEDIHSRLKWKERILKALDEDRFEVWVQPILHLKDNRVSHYEALARMRDEEGKVLLPGAFIEVAERFGIIGLIDRVIAKKALRLLAESFRNGRPFTLGINLSGKMIMDKDYLSFIRSAIREAGADANSIVFEITETAAVFDIERASKFIRALRSLGCHFALDDFGVGFTSFLYLREMAIDYIKIDGSFIRGLHRNRNDRLFVKAITDVAKGMKIKTVAEFVENGEILEILKEIGVDYAQGYHIGKPAPFRDLSPGTP